MNIVSFFSGGGFMDMGFEQAGFNIIWTNEIDSDFAQFYSEGVSSWSGHNRKISKIASIDDVNDKEILTLIKESGGKVWGIIGGPPCQDFSMRGKRVGFEGDKGSLMWSFYTKILDLKPDFFVMENVPGLVHSKKNKVEFNSILDLFSDEYHIDKKILNSLDYGVPQSRERLFVVGLKKSYELNDLKSEKEWFEWPSPLHNKALKSFNWPLMQKKSPGTFLPEPPEILCVESYLINTIAGTNALTSNTDEYFKIKNHEKVKFIQEGDTIRPSFKRLHRKKYSPTACYGNNEVHLHPTECRRISVREALRIQGVPDSYVLQTKGKLSKKFKMIGNGVPVPLAYAVATAMKEQVERTITDLPTNLKNQIILSNEVLDKNFTSNYAADFIDDVSNVSVE